MCSPQHRSWGLVLVLGMSLLLPHIARPAIGGTYRSPERVVKRPAWEPQGLSGGGAMFTPAISPVNPKLMMLNCDMSGAYVSRDGGRNWSMIHHSQLISNTRCRPAFHPRDAGTVFAASGWAGRLKVSHDGGVTWADSGDLPAGLRGEIVIDALWPEFMLVGVRDEVWRSTDGGTHWARCQGAGK